jgi:hypothetical protein
VRRIRGKIYISRIDHPSILSGAGSSARSPHSNYNPPPTAHSLHASMHHIEEEVRVPARKTEAKVSVPGGSVKQGRTPTPRREEGSTGTAPSQLSPVALHDSSA